MFQKIRTISATLFFSTLLFLTSCTDHNIESGPLKLTTLKSFGNSGYQIQVDEVGDKPVTEYGIVYTAYVRGVGDHNFNATIADRKIVFTTAISQGLNTYTGTVPNTGATFFYYRAYAIVNGSPVYSTFLSYNVDHP